MSDDGALGGAALVKVSAENPHGLVGVVSTAPGVTLGAARSSPVVQARCHSLWRDGFPLNLVSTMGL